MLAYLAAMLLLQSGTQQVRGTISASDPADGGGHYDAYPVALHAGRRVAITVSPGNAGADFDILVYDGDGARALAEASGTGDATRLSFTARASGIYMVRVRSAATGAYTLHVASAGSDDAGPEVDTAEPPSRFILCPGHPRCPRQ